MNDIADVLTELLTDLIERGFQLPIYVFACSEGGYVSAARYECDAEKENTKVRVFADHEEAGGWTEPVHFFFLDGMGKSESVRIDSDGCT